MPVSINIVTTVIVWLITYKKFQVKTLRQKSKSIEVSFSRCKIITHSPLLPPLLICRSNPSLPPPYLPHSLGLLLCSHHLFFNSTLVLFLLSESIINLENSLMTFITYRFYLKKIYIKNFYIKFFY
jgi:hypothetical protein